VHGEQRRGRTRRRSAAEASPQGPIRTTLKNISWIWTGLAIKIVVSLFMAPFVVASLGNVYYGIWTGRAPRHRSRSCSPDAPREGTSDVRPPSGSASI
jgi:hypothetical protein